MGSGDWFKTLIRLKKAKNGSSKRIKGSSAIAKSNVSKLKDSTNEQNVSPGMPIEEIAAIRIQTSIRAYMARKALRRLKGIVRLQLVSQGFPIQKQASSTLSHLHSWCKVQAQIRERRLYMVTEGRIKQKKLENQQKLEAKLHELEVEWSPGSETMDEILARIYQREEAAVKRERAMAYAFSHQWRANCSQSQGLGNDELSKTNWGWSWKERWIAARPWESRLPTKSISPKKLANKQANKNGKTTNQVKTQSSVKVPSSNGKATPKARRLSFTASEKTVALEGNAIVQEGNTNKEEPVS